MRICSWSSRILSERKTEFRRTGSSEYRPIVIGCNKGQKGYWLNVQQQVASFEYPYLDEIRTKINAFQKGYSESIFSTKNYKEHNWIGKLVLNDEMIEDIKSLKQDAMNVEPSNSSVSRGTWKTLTISNWSMDFMRFWARSTKG